jgi:tetratricopeptide (TPR) repeat protein
MPATLTPCYMLGQIHLEQGRPEEAIFNLRRVIREVPDNLEAYLILARAHFMNNEPLVGLENLRQVINRAPGYTPARKEIARYYQRNNDHERAAQELRRILDTQPGDQEARLMLGDIYALQGNASGAEKEYSYLLDMDSQAAVTGHFKLGGLAASKGDFITAHRHFDSALEITPNGYDVMEAKISVYFMQNKAVEAREFVLSLVDKYPNNPLFLDFLGRVEIGLGNIEQAEKVFWKALELEPDWVVPYNRIVGIYMFTDQLDRGVEVFEQALAKNPDSLQTAFILATLYHESGRIDLAEPMYKDILHQNPGFLAAANNLAYLYAKHSQDQETLEKALELAVQSAITEEPQALDTLGWIYYRLDNHEMALENLNKAWARSPGDPDIGYHLAVVLNETGSEDKALNVLQQLVQTHDPDRLNDEIMDLYNELAN